MYVVWWMRCHWVRIALLSVVVAVLGLDTEGAVASPVRRAATYEGDGRPPHVSKRTFLLEFRVAGDGRRLTVLNVWNLAAACGPVSSTTTRASALALCRFGAMERSRRSRGITRATSAAPGDGDWPLPEPRPRSRDAPAPPSCAERLQLRRRLDGACQGTSATRAALHWHHRHRNPRDLPAHDRTPPHVSRFNLGSLRTSCGDTETVMTGVNPWPPHDEFALPVDKGRFSGEYTGSMADYGGRIIGHFDAKDRASGTVSYRDRADCTIDTIQWTARPATNK